MTIEYDDFAKLELRVATVLDCKAHPNADKLLLLQVDLGGEQRQICAGLRQYYQPEQLIGKQVVVVANLAPRQMRGQISQGMLLAASEPAAVTPAAPAASSAPVDPSAPLPPVPVAPPARVIVVSPIEPVKPGSKVS